MLSRGGERYFAYKTDVDLSIKRNTNTLSAMVPFQGRNYKGRYFYAKLEIYEYAVFGTSRFTKVWHDCFLIQKDGWNASTTDRQNGWNIPTQYFVQERSRTNNNAWQKETSIWYHYNTGTSGKIADKEIEGRLLYDDLPVWFSGKNYAWYDGAGYRIKGTFYYD